MPRQPHEENDEARLDELPPGRGPGWASPVNPNEHRTPDYLRPTPSRNRGGRHRGPGAALAAATVFATLMTLETVAVEPPRLAMSNAEAELDLRIADNGPYRLTDRRTGEKYEALDLGVVTVWDRTEDRRRHVPLVPSPNPEDWRDDAVRIDVERLSDTAGRVRVDLGGDGSANAMGGTRLGVHFDIEIELRGKGLELAIPEASFEERHQARFRVLSIELLPGLGRTPEGSRGYLFLPSRSGSVFYFDRNHPRAARNTNADSSLEPSSAQGLRQRWGFPADGPAEYGSLVYGEQGRWEDLLTMPLYATVRDGAALAGIILGGAYDTKIVARRGLGSERCASVSPRFVYRRFWNSKRDTETRRIRLVLLRGSAAGYGGVANLYRDYLLDEAGVPTLKTRAAANPAIAYFRDSFYCRVMLGMSPGGVPKCYQSFDDVAETIRLYREAGFDKVSFIGVGANVGGHDWAHPTIFPVEPAFGGEEGLRRLVRAVNDAGYTFGLHVNYKDVYRHSADWREEIVQRNEWGELRYHGAWMGGYSYQGLPQRMLEFAQRDFPILREMGMQGFFYFDAVGGVMEETFPPGDAICRREYGEGMNAYLAEGERVFGCCGNEVSIAPSLGVLTHTNIFYPGSEAAKPDTCGYSRNGFIDHFVPAQCMVYHGLCLYSGGPEVGGMAGTEHRDKVTGEDVQADYARWRTAQARCGDLHYEFFVDHRELAPGITRSAFSDGTAILVNHTREPWTDGAVTLPARGHVVRRPGGAP